MLELVIVSSPECIEALEKSMEVKFGANLNPNSSEVFEQVSLSALKEAAISLLNVMCPDKYQIISHEIIDAYNQDVDLMIKEGIEPIEDEETEIEENKIENEIKECENGSNDEKHPIIYAPSNPSINENDNVNINIRIDLSELKTFTIKKLDSLLEKYNIPKHGNKDKKIEKLKNYFDSEIFRDTDKSGI